MKVYPKMTEELVHKFNINNIEDISFPVVQWIVFWISNLPTRVLIHQGINYFIGRIFLIMSYLPKSFFFNVFNFTMSNLKNTHHHYLYNILKN